MNSNQLTSIDKTTFKNLIKLEILWLENNQLKSLDATTFNGLISIQKLHLGNKLSMCLAESANSCFKDLIRIQII